MPAYVHVRDLEAFRAHVAGFDGSQALLARRAGTTSQRLSKMLAGTSTTVRVSLAIALEDALGVERATLFAGDEPGAAAYFRGVAA